MRQVLDVHRAKAVVELTSRCNMRCAMCPMGNLSRPEIDMPWWLVEKVAEDFRDNGIHVRWLHELGEPLLFPRLAEAIDLFPGAAVSTNVMLLDEERGRELLGTTLQRIRLCLDTVNPEIYPEVRRGGVFDHVVANIQTFLELSAGHDISVEIQRMVSLKTTQESKRDFEALFELDRFPQAKVIEKTCEGLDTTDATDLHEEFYGCFQGYPFRWFVVLSDGRVTHCCIDSEGEQPIGDMKTQTVQEILATNTAERYMAAFKAKDWETLPRCGECFRHNTSAAVVKSQLIRLGRRLERVLPVKQLARKMINR